MNERAVVILGEALWDVYPVRAGESIRARRREQRCLGGAPANVAVTLARLGLPVGMIAAVGDDPLGEGLRDELGAAGVDVQHVVSVRARTGVTWVELREGVPRYVPFRSPSADMLLDRSAVPERLDTGWLHVGSSSFARAESAAAVALAVERSPGASLSIDLNVYPHLWREAPPRQGLLDVLRAARVVKASESDLAALELSEDELRALRPNDLTIVTYAERGAVGWLSDRRFEHRPARAVEPIDPIGAGDAFMAGVLAVLVRHGFDVERALAFGAALGARAVGALGATTALLDLRRERAALARAPSVR